MRARESEVLPDRPHALFCVLIHFLIPRQLKRHVVLWPTYLQWKRYRACYDTQLHRIEYQGQK